MNHTSTKVKKRYVLGVSCFFHDSAVALTKDGVLVGAIAQERLSHKKHDASFPELAIKACLKKEGISIEDLEAVVFYEKPFLKFERIFFSLLKTWPFNFTLFHNTLILWLSQRLHFRRLLRKKIGYKGNVFFLPHHISHASSSFFTSNFSEATLLVVDGVGEYSTTSIGYGKEKSLFLEREISFPHSLGLLYSALTYYLGFRVNDGEYKVMGLAPYGVPSYKKIIYDNLLKIEKDESFSLNQDFFTYEDGDVMVADKFEKLFGQKCRKPNEKITEFHKNIARSIQELIEEEMVRLAKFAYKLFPSKNLCLSGGVALNCVANTKIIEQTQFENVFIFPGAGDDGAAVGASFFCAHNILNMERKDNPFPTIFLGEEFSEKETEHFLKRINIPYKKLDVDTLLKEVAKNIKEQKIIAWFQGASEFGPRSLGNRSILADPTQKENWKRINEKVKFRESFRPFAPAVTQESFSDYFDAPFKESPYMLFTAKSKTEKLPSTTHIDKSARVQTVTDKQNPKFYRLLNFVKDEIGVPCLINTSFNLAGEPIVNTPQDAWRTFLKCDLDILVLGNCIIKKSDINYSRSFKKK